MDNLKSVHHVIISMLILFIFFLILFMNSCSVFPPKPGNEIDQLAEDVIKHRQGIEIILNPVSGERQLSR